MNEFRVLEFSKKLGTACKTRMKGYEDVKINNGDLVFYQYENKDAWLGPEKVFTTNGGNVFILANGNIRKVPRCNVQLCKNEFENDKGKKEKDNAKVQFDEKVQYEEQGFANDIEDKDIEVINKRVTRSMSDDKREEMRKEEISTFWTQVYNSECFDELTICTVEVPVKEHKKSEVIETKQRRLRT